MNCRSLLIISFGVRSRFVTSLKTYYPSAYFTGPIPDMKLATCSIYESVNLLERVLYGFYSELSERRINLSMGMLKALRALSCYSLCGYPIKIYPFISSSLPLWLTTGIIYFSDKSYNGGVFGLYSSFFSFFLTFFGGAFFY